MRKEFYFGLLLLLFPFIVCADSISINCPTEVSNGNSFSCEIVGNSTSSIMSLKTNVSVTEGLSLVGFIPNSNWQGNMINDRISLYTDEDVTKEFKLGTIKVKATAVGDNIITLNEVYFYSDEDSVSVEDVSKKISIVEASTTTPDPEKKEETKEIETSTYVIDVTIENYYIDFDKNTSDYELTIKNEDKLNIEILLEDNSSVATITGNEKLKEGSVITITVVDQYGKNERKYNIKIHKEGTSQVIGGSKNSKLIFFIIIGVLVVINILRFLVKGKNKAGGK